jgi:dihydroneopterin aldolase
MHKVPLTERESLLFEAGIKLGGIFHQYLGVPVSPKTATALAHSIEAAVALQPFVVGVRVRIVPARGGAVGRGRFGYRYVTAEMLDARVTLADGATRVVARLSYRPELRYPLMQIESANKAGLKKGRRAG